MRLSKKMLSLISFYALFANLTSKPANSHFNFSDLATKAYVIVNNCKDVLPYGVKTTPKPVVFLFVPITAYKSIKEKPKSLNRFLNIIKSSLNKSFKITKWVSNILSGLIGMYIIYDNVHESKKGDPPRCGCEALLPFMGLTVTGTVAVLSWIGQKLTEDKEKTQKNDALKTINYNEKEITK